MSASYLASAPASNKCHMLNECGAACEYNASVSKLCAARASIRLSEGKGVPARPRWLLKNHQETETAGLRHSIETTLAAASLRPQGAVTSSSQATVRRNAFGTAGARGEPCEALSRTANLTNPTNRANVWSSCGSDGWSTARAPARPDAVI